MNNEWQPMSTAPRDGTWVELRCTYGVAPWYGLFRWSRETLAHGADGLVSITLPDPGWHKNDGDGVSDEDHFSWRPTSMMPDTYTDPTGGFQNDPQYWRQAVAGKYGLPANYFEAEARRNERRRRSPTARGWLGRLFGK